MNYRMFGRRVAMEKIAASIAEMGAAPGGFLAGAAERFKNNPRAMQQMGKNLEDPGLFDKLWDRAARRNATPDPLVADMATRQAGRLAKAKALRAARGAPAAAAKGAGGLSGLLSSASKHLGKLPGWGKALGAAGLGAAGVYGLSKLLGGGSKPQPQPMQGQMYPPQM